MGFSMISYCYECDKEVKVILKEQEITTDIKGTSVSYIGNIAYCNECGEEVYISKIDDENIRKANEKYREAIGIIQQSEVKDLLTKYNIGQKPLANLLGWGEATIARYVNGLMPTKEYSNRLKELFNTQKMKELFDKRKDVLTPVAQRKVESKLKKLLETNEADINRPLQVANYFLSKIDIEAGESITPLKIQKLVCISQSWILALFKKTLFNEDIQARQHGPVIPDLYMHFKNQGFNSNDSLPKVNDFDINIFNEEEKSVLEMVWKVYGKYDGKYLEKICHMDESWKTAWEKREEANRGTVVISKESMQKCYTKLKEQLDFDINSINSLNKLCCYLNCID
ncbi:MAG TPA: DUF4065 domain-containing protein [Acetivibrio sp.]|jgi:putative zinc finger/helix-turn-helix YgiT family protein|nr:DUF4065 domain-containing protein [Acetivibrio sp.]HPT77321.1 DUF4065 domain-containing protein [Defluviitaleaceae bacterium]HQA58358.1 DUF4065 domain-containing protein [Acetivibrio sp.]